MSDFSQNPLLVFLYWVLNTPGVGAFIVAALGSGLVIGFALVLRWIAAGAKVNDNVRYTYPTEGLHHQEK